MGGQLYYDSAVSLFCKHMNILSKTQLYDGFW